MSKYICISSQIVFEKSGEVSGFGSKLYSQGLKNWKNLSLIM